MDVRLDGLPGHLGRGLEQRAHVDVVLEAFAVRNKAKYSPPVITPIQSSRKR